VCVCVVHACMRACERACVRACLQPHVCACVYACVCLNDGPHAATLLGHGPGSQGAVTLSLLCTFLRALCPLFACSKPITSLPYLCAAPLTVTLIRCHPLTPLPPSLLPLSTQVNVLSYFETLCVDTNAANVLINSSLTILFIRMLRNARAPTLRIRLASVGAAMPRCCLAVPRTTTLPCCAMLRAVRTPTRCTTTLPLPPLPCCAMLRAARTPTRCTRLALLGAAPVPPPPLLCETMLCHGPSALRPSPLPRNVNQLSNQPTTCDV